jgi:deazaflavin-dependent oxidoreductase (nitroreductase family)
MALKEMQNATPTTTFEGERMSPTTTTTAAAPPGRVIGSCVPSRRALRLINPFVSMILRSPLHRALSSRLLLLTFTGRKTGKRYTIPVGYTREDDTLTIFSSYSWWKNLRGDFRVAMHLQGRKRTGHAEVIEESAAAVESVEHLVEKYGLKDATNRTGLALDISPPPTTDELAAAIDGHVVIRIILG